MCVGNILVCVLQHRDVTVQLMSALDDVKDTLSASKVRGETATVIATDDLTLRLEKLVAFYYIFIMNSISRILV